MAEFVYYLVLGIVVGALYSMIALGLVLIFRANGIFNFAHGNFMVIGALIIWSLVGSGGLPLWASIILGIGCITLMGLLVERWTIKPMMGQSALIIIMLTLGLNFALESVTCMAWGSRGRGYPITYLPEGTFSLSSNIDIAQSQVYILLATLVIFGIVFFYIRYSRQGLAMQAIADDVEGSRGVGVRVTTTLALTWGLAAAAAGISGYFLGNIVGINPPNMPVYAFKAFVVMLLGGLQSVGGALIAGPIIGIVEHLGGAYLDPILGGGVKGMLPFLVAIIILTIRPQGLFGWKTIERV